MKIGITGGIGSGKSYVAQLLSKRGIAVYDCDAAAKRLLRSSTELQQQLKALVGSLEKAEISRFLLASDANKLAINAIIHPAVFKDFAESGQMWMESAILYECGADRLVDRVIAVTAPQNIRLQRIMKRDGITRAKALEWIHRQWPQQKVRRLADYIIVNDGVTDVEKQLDEIMISLSQNDDITK